MTSRPTSQTSSKSADTGTLGKALDVLEIIAASEHSLRFSEILERSDQPRGTLHRQLSNLLREDLIHLNIDQSYGIGVRLLKLASRAWSRNEFRAAATRGLQWLHEQTGETTHLAVLRGVEVIYLDKVESDQTVRMHSQIGNASPAYCTGVGKAAMSCLGEAQLDQLLPQMSFQRFTEHTINSTDALRRELAEIRRLGFAYDREEHELGIKCIAAPVVPADQSFLGGISATGPAYRVSDQTLDSWQAGIQEAAQKIIDDVQTLLGPRRGAR